MARSVYGVVVTVGEVDDAGTAEARRLIRERRLAEGRALEGSVGGGRVDGGTVLHPVSDSVEAVEVDGRRSLRCSVCRYRFGGYEDDHKRSTLMRELPLTAISPHNRLCLPEFVLREFYCPECATALATDVQRRDEPILDESRLLRPGQP
jgi:hypothetical protein